MVGDPMLPARSYAVCRHRPGRLLQVDLAPFGLQYLIGPRCVSTVHATGAVFEAKFMLPWTFSEDAAAEKHMAQLQHNMWVANARTAALSIITGGGKWVELTLHADLLYQHLLLTAEKKFWRCVMSGEEPRLFGVEPPRPRLEAVRIVDMSASN